jgi:hypothetical protein
MDDVGGRPISIAAGHQNIKLKLRNGKKLDPKTVPRLMGSILARKRGEELYEIYIRRPGGTKGTGKTY